MSLGSYLPGMPSILQYYRYLVACRIQVGFVNTIMHIFVENVLHIWREMYNLLIYIYLYIRIMYLISYLLANYVHNLSMLLYKIRVPSENNFLSNDLHIWDYF